MSLEFECLSAGTPLCRVRVLARHSDSVRPACKKLLKPHSIGDVPEVKEIREGSSSINIRLEFSPRDLISLRVYSHDRFFCEACQVPNDPIACEHMIWFVEKIARFQFQEHYGNDLPVTLVMTEDAKMAQWEEHKFRIDSTHSTLKSHRSHFFAYLIRQLDLQRVIVTLDPYPIDGDWTTAQVWSTLGEFLMQLPLEDPIPREQFLRMHFDKVRRWLKHAIHAEASSNVIDDLATLDVSVSKNLARAARERYLSRDIINDAAEVLVQVLALVNSDENGGALWKKCTERSPGFFLDTMKYIQSGQALQQETLADLRQGLNKALAIWKMALTREHWAAFEAFLNGRA